MNSIVNSNDVLAALRQRKLIIRKRLEGSRMQLVDTAGGLTSPLPKATGRAQSISRIITGGLVLYRGFRLCSDVAAGIHSFFAPKKRRR